ncbi:flavin reductase family protein [Helicobacter sp. 11S02596-1]|uniref:flavin reductase family protein n=1 Tax=Helicobacter sp. 11S02596-1 TaxID=1476194 RepID=UPI000BA5FFB9|nr:flavin reductase family protein [Helicobacter sp. 11S02596-1]PAF42486.1 hypothetical protein BJI48_06720 [Helicobacter sp. 11S02596-1]
MQIDFKHASPLTKYKILSNTITPRPIAWISTTDENGIINLAPFSFFAPISPNPVVFSVCITPKSDGSMKDTLKNILATKKATICMCDEKNLKSLNQSATELEYGVSEALRFNIALEVIENGYPPIIKGSLVAFMCELYDVLAISQDSKPVLLEASRCFIDDKIYQEDLKFILKNVGRVGKYYQLPSEWVDPKNL